MGQKIAVTCPSCRGAINAPVRYAGQSIACPGCKMAVAVPGLDVPPNLPAPPPVIPAIESRYEDPRLSVHGRKYKMLDLVGRWYWFLGVVTLVAGVGAGVLFGITASRAETLSAAAMSLGMAASAILVSAISAISLIAVSDGIALAMDVEEHLRDIRRNI